MITEIAKNIDADAVEKTKQEYIKLHEGQQNSKEPSNCVTEASSQRILQERNR